MKGSPRCHRVGRRTGQGGENSKKRGKGSTVAKELEAHQDTARGPRNEVKRSRRVCF